MSYQGTILVSGAAYENDDLKDLTTWDSRPDGSYDGQYGIATGDTVYRWKASVSEWVRAELWDYTYTQLGATLGDSTTPTGWTKTGSNYSTDGTALTIGVSSPNSAADYLSVSPTGARLYVIGYVHCTSSSGSEIRQSMFSDYIDGTKRRIFGSTSGQILSASGSGSPGVGMNVDTDVSTRAWYEAYFIPSGSAYAWMSNSPVADSAMDYGQSSSVVLDRFAVGDGTGSGAGVIVVEGFRVFTLT